MEGDTPMLGKEDEQTGVVILCPFDTNSGPHPPHDRKR